MAVVPDGPVRRRLVEITRCWLGTPYVHQASCRGAGADCLGLVLGVWREALGNAPPLPCDYSPDWQAEAAGARLEAATRQLLLPRDGDILPGMVLLFRLRPRAPGRHLGIAMGCEEVVHAASGLGVVAVPLSRPWRRRIVGMFDFPGCRHQ